MVSKSKQNIYPFTSELLVKYLKDVVKIDILELSEKNMVVDMKYQFMVGRAFQLFPPPL